MSSALLLPFESPLLRKLVDFDRGRDLVSVTRKSFEVPPDMSCSAPETDRWSSG